ncbi:hypothetical protein HDU97_005356 [Phlyctochytrium planicorne]|nr:hypothetical protein HDU97_005356 [Phlyctochytrium planicorne]
MPPSRKRKNSPDASTAAMAMALVGGGAGVGGDGMDDIFKVLKERMANKSAERKKKIAAEYEKVNGKIQGMAMEHVSGFQRTFEACVSDHKAKIEDLVNQHNDVLTKLQAENEKMTKVHDDFLSDAAKLEKSRKKLEDQLNQDLKTCYSDMQKMLEPYLPSQASQDSEDSSPGILDKALLKPTSKQHRFLEKPSSNIPKLTRAPSPPSPPGSSDHSHSHGGGSNDPFAFSLDINLGGGGARKGDASKKANNNNTNATAAPGVGPGAGGGVGRKHKRDAAAALEVNEAIAACLPHIFIGSQCLGAK